MVPVKKDLKRFKVVLAPEFAKIPGEGADIHIQRTFESEVLYIYGTDTYVAAGSDFDYFCIRGADGTTCFTVPAYKVRYCTERPRKTNAKVFRPKSVK